MDLKNFTMGSVNWEDTKAVEVTASSVVEELVEESLRDPSAANEANWNEKLLSFPDLFDGRKARLEARKEVVSRLFGEGAKWEGLGRVERKSAGSSPRVVGSEEEMVKRWVGEDRYSVTGVGGTLYRTTPAKALDHANPYKALRCAQLRVRASEARLHELRNAEVEVEVKEYWGAQSGAHTYCEGPTLERVEYVATMVWGEQYRYEGERKEALSYFQSLLAEKVEEEEEEVSRAALEVEAASKALADYEAETVALEAAYYASLQRG